MHRSTASPKGTFWAIKKRRQKIEKGKIDVRGVWEKWRGECGEKMLKMLY